MKPPGRTARTIRSLFVALLSLAVAAPVGAQMRPAPGAQPMLEVAAENRTARAEVARGARSRADTTVHVGDVLRYRLTFVNAAPHAIRNVALANPVPGALQFVGGSARASRADARAEYSLDGGRTWSARPMEAVLVDGRQVERAVAPERYTAVRWVVNGAVAPSAVVTAEFEARLAGASPSSAAMSPAKAPSAAVPSTPGAR